MKKEDCVVWKDEDAISCNSRQSRFVLSLFSLLLIVHLLSLSLVIQVCVDSLSFPSLPLSSSSCTKFCLRILLSLPSVTLCVCFSFTLSLLSKDPKILLLFQLHQLQSCIWCSLSSSLSFFFKGRNSLCDTIHESKNSRSEKRERERDATSLLLCLPFPLFPHFDRSFCSLLSKVSSLF